MKKILVVEDNAIQAEHAVKSLSDKYEVIMARNLDQAMSHERTGFNLILSDLCFPEKEGEKPSALSGLRLVSEHTKQFSPLPPIVVVSNYEHHIHDYGKRGGFTPADMAIMRILRRIGGGAIGAKYAKDDRNMVVFHKEDPTGENSVFLCIDLCLVFYKQCRRVGEAEILNFNDEYNKLLAAATEKGTNHEAYDSLRKHYVLLKPWREIADLMLQE